MAMMRNFEVCKSCFLDFVPSPTARVSVLPFYLKTEEDPASET
jgi:hypothetical protein